MQAKHLTRHEVRQRRRRRRKIRKKIEESLAAVIAGLMLAGVFVWSLSNDNYEPEYSERYEEIQNYNAMVAEREAYLETETAEPEIIEYSIPTAGVIKVTYQMLESVDETEPEVTATEAVSTTTAESSGWSDDDEYYLAKIAMAEAEGEDLTSKALVICVVINRVNSDDFPNTVLEVITEDGQFSPVSDGRWQSVEPNEECYEALDMVLNGWDESQGATYFECTTERTTWHSSNLQKLFSYQNTTFYKEAD